MNKCCCFLSYLLGVWAGASISTPLYFFYCPSLLYHTPPCSLHPFLLSSSHPAMLHLPPLSTPSLPLSSHISSSHFLFPTSPPLPLSSPTPRIPSFIPHPFTSLLSFFTHSLSSLLSSHLLPFPLSLSPLSLPPSLPPS